MIQEAEELTEETSRGDLRSLGLSQRSLAYLALGFSVLVLSLSAMFVRWAGVPGTVTSFYRMAIAGLFLTVFIGKRSVGRLPGRKALLLLPLLGGLFTALDHTVWSTAIGMTNIANATLLNNIAPLWVALVAFLFWKERLSKRFWMGLALALVGAAVVFGNDLMFAAHLSLGDLLALFSSLFYAGYFLVTQRSREHFETMPYVWLTVLTAAVVLLAVNLATGQQLTGFAPRTYLIFLAAALISQIGGYFSMVYALGKLPAAVVSPTMIAQPVLTALIAIPFAGEFLTPGQWLGGFAVLLGIYLVNKR